MRNRGIELFLLPASASSGRSASAAVAAATAGTPTCESTAEPLGQPLALLGPDGALAAAGDLGPSARLALGPSEGEDLQALLAAEGVPGWALPAAMVAGHQAVVQLAAARHR